MQELSFIKLLHVVKSIFMVKFFFTSLLFFFTSCHTYNMLDGKSKPVYFKPDTSVFNDSDFQNQSIFYEDLLNLRGNFPNVVTLKKDTVSMAIIRSPTFFGGYGTYLVYPREHILITKGKFNDFTFSKIHGSKRRNKELSFFNFFYKIENYPIVPHINNLSIDSIFLFENQLKIKIQESEIKNKVLFDSLAKAYRVSSKFRRSANDYISYRYPTALYELYKEYKDTLLSHNLYVQKCEQLISVFNSMTEKSKFNGIYIFFNEIANEVLPYRVNGIKNETEFKECFDSIETKFNYLAKEYLLSQLMYRAYTERLQIDSNYLKKYQHTCKDESYKELINNIKTQQEKIDIPVNYVSSNSLIEINGKTSTIENIISDNKGEVTFIDFWATWCAPCRAEVPYLKILMQEYAHEKIRFVSISIDKEIQPWQKLLYTNENNTDNTYLLINSDKSSFVKRYSINEIPRYILVDKTGKIVNDNAPRPSNPQLKQLINKSLAD